MGSGPTNQSGWQNETFNQAAAQAVTITKTPEQKLVSLLETETGVEMDAKLMRLFLLAHWDKVSLYSHQIHDKAKE